MQRAASITSPSRYRQAWCTRACTHLSLISAQRLEGAYRDAVFMLGEAGHFNDTDTGVHIWRMAAYSRALAEAAKWPRERVELIELAAPMHDTGKIGIPDEILKKPTVLDAAEWMVMRNHARIGYEILKKSDAPVFQLAAEVALHHHEKWDGSGYPCGLAGTAIPEAARIVAVADVFDALTMKRPYKPAWPVDQALAYLDAGAGVHFDPAMIALFRRITPGILAIKTEWERREGGGEAA